MSPLTVVLAMLAATVASGPFLVAAFSLGHYGWPAVLLAFALGAFAALALSSRIEAEIKRQDPDWDEERDRAHPYAMLRARVPVRPDASHPRRDRER